MHYSYLLTFMYLFVVGLPVFPCIIFPVLLLSTPGPDSSCFLMANMYTPTSLHYKDHLLFMNNQKLTTHISEQITFLIC
jgi:hypothetical protein